MPDIEPTPATAPTATPAPAPETPKPVVPASALPDDALKPRLEAAKATGRNDLLRELGVTDPAQLKAALDAIKTAEEAKKTDAERATAQAVELAKAQAKLGEYSQAIDTMWTAEAPKLTPEQLSAVNTIAGDDNAKRLQTLNALRATWAMAPVATQQTQPAAPPANTAPAPNAPPATTVSPTDTKAVYASLNARNPVAAANYAAQHPEVFS
jgi:hypothetical protein